MQKFRTEIEIPKSDIKIDFSKKLFFMGSCFTENIGNKFSELFFKTDINPFGILYNPISIKNSFELLIDKKVFTSEDIFFHNETYQSFYHHSRFSNYEQKLCLENINSRIDFSSEFLKNADLIFITFGTSYIYNLANTETTVSNCHKLPSSKFDKKLLTVNEIVDNYKILFDKLFEINPKLKIILTISPIRHWNDGAIQNQLSKSILFVAVNQLLDIYKNVKYFPSYEIVMDELRDYRFYAEDMLHISQTAIDYIWEKFLETFFENTTLNLISEIEKLQKAKLHRPFNKNSENHKKFLRSNLTKIKELETNFCLNIFEDLRNYFENELK